MDHKGLALMRIGFVEASVRSVNTATHAPPRICGALADRKKKTSK